MDNETTDTESAPATFRDRIRKSLDDHPKTVLIAKFTAAAAAGALALKAICSWNSADEDEDSELEDELEDENLDALNPPVA